ncbi:hypothetical protein TNCT_208841 [Trichonephila clavata]|uniref:Uncharacterized protein n=1 Tax=Trichonephila clavata TaxID=2740835 RepID=A0A8X6KZR7_TRICU|nr:hypothetical protein TNCT_208841 [Trichonephila clavata]
MGFLSFWRTRVKMTCDTPQSIKRMDGESWRSGVTQTPEYIKQNNTSGRFLRIGVNLLTCVQPLDPVIRANKVHFRTNCEESTIEMKLHQKEVSFSLGKLKRKGEVKKTVDEPILYPKSTWSVCLFCRQEKLRCETENPDSRPRRGKWVTRRKWVTKMSAIINPPCREGGDQLLNNAVPDPDTEPFPLLSRDIL